MNINSGNNRRITAVPSAPKSQNQQQQNQQNKQKQAGSSNGSTTQPEKGHSGTSVFDASSPLSAKFNGVNLSGGVKAAGKHQYMVAKWEHEQQSAGSKAKIIAMITDRAINNEPVEIKVVDQANRNVATVKGNIVGGVVEAAWETPITAKGNYSFIIFGGDAVAKHSANKLKLV